MFNAAGEPLLLRRANTGFMDGHYALPGGHRQTGETVTAAAIPECEFAARAVFAGMDDGEVDGAAAGVVRPFGDVPFREQIRLGDIGTKFGLGCEPQVERLDAHKPFASTVSDFCVFSLAPTPLVRFADQAPRGPD